MNAKESNCIGSNDTGITVSIIVPVYKVEDYLERCVLSLINQTYSNFDIYLVDDGSPDKCPEICDRLSSRYEKVHAFHKRNGGLSDARNYGVQRAASDWIVFVDSDDYVEPTYIETLINLKNKYDADLVITRTSREDTAGKKYVKCKPFDSYITDKKTALYRVYSGIGVGWAAYGKLYRKEDLLKYPFPDGYYEDCACMYNIITSAERIAIGNYEENYHYIQREGSILISPLSQKHYRIFEIVNEFEKFIQKKYPELEILNVSFHKRAIVQMFSLQKMPWKDYRALFNKYKKYFRANLGLYVKQKDISTKAKGIYLLLCTRPEIFYIARKVVHP